MLGFVKNNETTHTEILDKGGEFSASDKINHVYTTRSRNNFPIGGQNTKVYRSGDAAQKLNQFSSLLHSSQEKRRLVIRRREEACDSISKYKYYPLKTIL